ncbi:hypothetical protein MBLNU230_g3687t1 [Neophaeotheca triangularis]
MAQDGEDDRNRDRQAQAQRVLLHLCFTPYQIHFGSPAYMKPEMLDMLDKKCVKATLKACADKIEVRHVIGTDAKFWVELGGLLKAAIPSLERRSFSIWDPTSVDYDSTSGALIAAHYPGLDKDLERINDLVSIARNVFVAGEEVQNLAAEHNIETDVFRLINCCVRVTARGFDGDAGTGDEEKWQHVINNYKKLLISCIQMLNNYGAQNEHKKLSLWIALFDHTSQTPLTQEDIPETSGSSLNDVPSNPTAEPGPPCNELDLLYAYGRNHTETIDLDGAEVLWEDDPWLRFPTNLQEDKDNLRGNGYTYFLHCNASMIIEDYQLTKRRPATAAEIHLDMPTRWSQLGEEYEEMWHKKYEDAHEKYLKDLAVWEAKVMASPRHQRARQAQQEAAQEESEIDRFSGELPPKAKKQSLNDVISEQLLQPRSMVADDLKMLFSATAGTKILRSGKYELMKRLEGYEPRHPGDPSLPPSRNPDFVTTRLPGHDPDGVIWERTPSMSRSPDRLHSDDPRNMNPKYPSRETRRLAREAGAMHIANAPGRPADEEPSEEEESEEEEEEADDEEYSGSTEDGRGLLTDVPLILGPSEIEVLPMLVMSGITTPEVQLAECKNRGEENALINMHTVRCHLLLAQDNGRNLLRELLIFVAAWDLREEELYFKFMVKIMEAILQNGLMPYAYHAFRDRSRSKDIISPAQAVIMKLLTNIFRARSEARKAAEAADPSLRMKPNDGASMENLTPFERVERLLNQKHTPNVPQRVDLHILNFIFTEFRQHIIPQTCALIFLQGQIHQGRASPEDFPLNLWDMERMYEGVYQYLEFFAVLTEEGVWKEVLGGWEVASELVTLLRELEAGIPKMGGQVAPTRRAAAQPAPPVQQPVRSASDDATTRGRDPTPVAVERPFDVESPEPTLPPLPLPVPASTPNQIFEAETPLAYPEDTQDEPSDFEWRNLKKLTVLVLSSLIWKNKLVQDQVRNFQGLSTLVSCCRPDDHNPYIREHAIMCLRFAVEGNEENAKVIQRMAGLRPEVEGGTVTLAGSGSTGSHHGYEPEVPREVLDTNGYETFMDVKGQVGLRRKADSVKVGILLKATSKLLSKANTDQMNKSPKYHLDKLPSVFSYDRHQPIKFNSSFSGNTTNSTHEPDTLPATTHNQNTQNSTKKPNAVFTPTIGNETTKQFSASLPGAVHPAQHRDQQRLTTKLTAEKAAELMQNALRDLPLGDKLVTDRQKAEALAKLDRAFESTEKALGRGYGGEGSRR